MIPGQPGSEGGGAEHVDGVAGVLGVAADGQPAAALEEVGVAPGAGDALAEAQVGPRAVRQRRLRAQEDVELGVVDVHAVGDHDVAAEHAEGVEVHDRPVGRCGRGTPRRRRPSARGGTSGSCRGRWPGARCDDEFVGHQVVADERHPAAHGAVAGGERQHVTLTVEHVGDVAGQGQAGGVRPPAAERAADADAVVGGEHTLGVADRAGLDGERDAVG